MQMFDSAHARHDVFSVATRAQLIVRHGFAPLHVVRRCCAATPFIDVNAAAVRYERRRRDSAWLSACTMPGPAPYVAPQMDSNHAPDAFPDSSRFDAVVRGRSWEWLDAVSRGLHLEVQIVDPEGRSRIAADALAQTALTGLVAAAPPGLIALVRAAITSRTPQGAAVQGLRVSAYPLSDRGDVVGAVLITHTSPPRHGNRVETDLDFAAQIVLDAIDAYLQAAVAASEGSADEVGSLARLLDTIASHGTDRELVFAFAAALAFWNQVQVFGYVMAGHGTFAADVSPPLPTLPKMPPSIPMALLPPASALTPLSPSQINALGIPKGSDVFVARIPDGEFPWLLVCSGTIAGRDVQRLGLYLRLLEHLMRTALAEALGALVTVLSAHLLEHADVATTDAAAAALDALVASTGMASSALRVTTAVGAPLLQIGQVDPVSGDLATGSRLVTTRRVPNRYASTLVVTSNQGRLITRQQREIVDAAANVLDAWIRGIVARGQSQDRRETSRPVAEVLDQLAAQALERGSTVSAIVMLMTDAATFPGLTQQWVSRIRGTMRSSDTIGMLGEGEVALLLEDTARDRADAVARRVVSMLEAARYPSPVVTFGFASRAPGSAGRGLVADARNDAMSQAATSLMHEQRNPSEGRS